MKPKAIHKVWRENSRWLSVGVIWEQRHKGAFLNLLCWTIDVSYGTNGPFDEPGDQSFEFCVKGPLRDPSE
jgi:hypothetical protein